MRLTGLYPLLSQGMFLRSGFYCCDKSGEICVSNDSSIMHFTEMPPEHLFHISGSEIAREEFKKWKYLLPPLPFW